MHHNEYLQLADWRRRTAAIYAAWREESVLDAEGATLRLRQSRGNLFHDHPQSPLPVDGRSRFGGISYWAYDPAYRLRAVLEPDEEPAGTEIGPLGAPPDAGTTGRADTSPTRGPAPADRRADDATRAPAPSDQAVPLSTGGGSPVFSLSSAYRSAATMTGLHWPTTLGAASPAKPEPPPIELPVSGSEPYAFRRVGRVRLSGPLAGEALAVFWMEGYAGGLFIPFRDTTSGDETYGAGRYLIDTAKGADHGVDPASGELLLDFNLAYHPSCVYDARWNCPLAPAENAIGEEVRVGERLG